jgi:hypothetical protein
LTEQSFIRLHGYAILPNIFPHNEISEVADVISQSQLKRRRAGARHILSVPAVCKVAEDLRLLSIARDVLGQTAIPFRATLFDKSPSSNWLVVWHQDTALPLVKKTEELAGYRGRSKRVLAMHTHREKRSNKFSRFEFILTIQSRRMIRSE